MKNHIIRDSQPILLVGGAAIDDDVFAMAGERSRKIVAADNGASSVLRAGAMPDAVIGDFDSLCSETAAKIPASRLHQVAEQDTTDFEKCLSRIDAPLIIGIGFSGMRLDHELAALTVLTKYPNKRCILIGSEMITFVAPPALTLQTQADDIVSLYPLGSVRGRSEGLEWPIEGLDFSPLCQIGTSNRANGTISLGFDAPNMLILLPRFRFAEVFDALTNASAFWPEI